jgi:hypothetical protein
MKWSISFILTHFVTLLFFLSFSLFLITFSVIYSTLLSLISKNYHDWSFLLPQENPYFSLLLFEKIIHKLFLPEKCIVSFFGIHLSNDFIMDIYKVQACILSYDKYFICSSERVFINICLVKRGLKNSCCCKISTTLPVFLIFMILLQADTFLLCDMQIFQLLRATG